MPEMQKDLKIGMVLGFVLAAAAAVWLSTHPSLSTKARMLHYEQADTNNTQRDTRFHTVLKDETLSDISRKYYGSANNWQKILDANHSRIKDANKLREGTKLFIPE